MDTPKVLTLDEALALVKRYKQVIASRFTKEPLVLNDTNINSPAVFLRGNFV